VNLRPLLRQATMPLAIAVLVALAGVWFVLSFEKVGEEEFEPPTADAQRNRFLAAERLLAGLGIVARRLDGLEGDYALAPDSALLVPARRGALSAAALARLERFVDEGGHLLVEAEPLTQADPLLALFDIERVESAYPRWGSSWWRDRNRQLTHGGSADDALRTGIESGEPAMAVRIQPGDLALDAIDLLWALDDDGDVLVLQRLHGAGRVTALADMSPFENWEIGHLDHAEWLHRLLAGPAQSQPPASVAIVQAWRGGLARWLLDSAWRVLLAGGVLLLALLWAAMPRFGPVAADPEPARRRLLDHLAASGRLLWLRGERRMLAQAATDAALARVRREFPHSAAMAPDAFAALLCRRCGLDSGQAQALLAASMPTQPAAFLYLLRACRRVHATLSTHVPHPSDALFETGTR
jgi:hypothetical protein